MRDYSRRMTGRVDVEGESSWCYSGLFASLDRFGLKLPRLQPSGNQLVQEGPHISLVCINVRWLANSLHFAPGRKLRWNCAGSYLGHIESRSGSEVTDLAHGTFPIVQTELVVMLNETDVVFELQGECGIAMASPFAGEDKEARAPRFKLSLTVADDELLDFLGHEGEVASFKEARRRAMRISL